MSYSSRESQATAPGRAAAHNVAAIVLPAPGGPVTTVSGHHRVPRVISLVIRGRWIAQFGIPGTVTLDSRMGSSAGTANGSVRASARLAVDIATETSPDPRPAAWPPHAVRDDMVGRRAGYPPGARGRSALLHYRTPSSQAAHQTIRVKSASRRRSFTVGPVVSLPGALVHGPG